MRAELVSFCIVWNVAFGAAFAPATVFHHCQRTSSRMYSTAPSDVEDATIPEQEPSEDDTRRKELKDELLSWSGRTDRGFQATGSDAGQVKQVIFELAKFNPTAAPASAYYDNTNNSEPAGASSLQGKWTLIYTDAPDITGLDSGVNPLVKLGRIGQDCSQPPTIANVIEWTKPEWVDSSPLIPALLKGEPSSNRILQKVLTKGKAKPNSPSKVNLEIAGLQIQAPPGSSSSSLQESIAQKGLFAGLLEQQPVDLQGPLQAPFGEFELLYLDEDMRITRTGQNFFAVNVRIKDGDEEWF